jgi:hypothetical protein
MESERPPPLSPTLLSDAQHFSSLISWPDHWQPQASKIISDKTTSEVTPMAHEDLLSSADNVNFRNENSRRQSSNTTKSSTLFVTCDTDPSMHIEHQYSTRTQVDESLTMFNMAASDSSMSPVHPMQSHIQCSSMTSDMTLTRVKFTEITTSSALSSSNNYSIRTSQDTLTTSEDRLPLPRKSLSIKNKSSSADDHRSIRTIGKSVVEHLVFVFPDNVRRILAEPKK